MDDDGRPPTFWQAARKTGRTVYFNTVVSPDFKAWLKGESGITGKTMAALLDDMRVAYMEKKAAQR